MKRPWFWGKTGHDGYCLAELTFAQDLREYPLVVDDYREIVERRWEWMKGDRFFLAEGLLERLEQGMGYCSSHMAVRGPTLEFYHSLGPCVAGLAETRLMLRLASELELVSWRFEVGCRSVDTWAEGRDGASLERHLRGL